MLQWPVGSIHQVYFAQSLEADGYPGKSPVSRQDWNSLHFLQLDLVGSSTPRDQVLLSVTVGPGLTQILGQVTKEMTVAVDFTGYTDPNLPCSQLPVQTIRAKASLRSSACFSAPGTFWITPGAVSLAAAPFPGYIFTNWLVNGNVSGTDDRDISSCPPTSRRIREGQTGALSFQSARPELAGGPSAHQARSGCHENLFRRSLLPDQLFPAAHRFPRGIHSLVRGRLRFPARVQACPRRAGSASGRGGKYLGLCRIQQWAGTERDLHGRCQRQRTGHRYANFVPACPPG